MTDNPSSELRQNFDHFDANSDGKIELEEFSRLMDALGASEPGEETLIGFQAIDADGSGVIEFDEFEAWFTDR
jgi:calmodulin